MKRQLPVQGAIVTALSAECHGALSQQHVPEELRTHYRVHQRCKEPDRTTATDQVP